jgi:hypothetical protein
MAGARCAHSGPVFYYRLSDPDGIAVVDGL